VTLTVEFVLPLASELGGNSRGSWHKREQARKDGLQQGYFLTHEALWREQAFPQGAKAYRLQICFYASGNADVDNLLGRAKFVLDGMAMALGTNDRAFGPIIIERKPAPKGSGRRARAIVQVEVA